MQEVFFVTGSGWLAVKFGAQAWAGRAGSDPTRAVTPIENRQSGSLTAY